MDKLAQSVVREIPLAQLTRVLRSSGPLRDPSANASGSICGCDCDGGGGSICGWSCDFMLGNVSGVVDPANHSGITKEDIAKARKDVAQLRSAIAGQVQNVSKGILAIR